jgi:hypothetical protein
MEYLSTCKTKAINKEMEIFTVGQRIGTYKIHSFFISPGDNFIKVSLVKEITITNDCPNLDAFGVSTQERLDLERRTMYVTHLSLIRDKIISKTTYRKMYAIDITN